MKIKYYLIGMGVGIILTTLLLSISYHSKSQNSLSDEEIIKRAMNLGMEMKEDSDIDLDDLLTPNLTPAAQPSILPETDDSNEDNKSGESDASEGENKTDESSNLDKQSAIVITEEDNNTNSTTGNSKINEANTVDVDSSVNDITLDTNSENNYVTVEISGGMTSYEVSRLLRDNGIIEKSYDFNKFMQENNYALTINVGTFLIKKNSTYEEIAKIITNKPNKKSE